MVIDFLVLMSIVFNSSFIQSNTPALYLLIPTVHAFIPAITFPQFNFDLSNFFTLQVYSLFIFFLFMMGSNCSTPKYLYLLRLASPISISPGNWIPSVQTIFRLFMTRTAHLSRPNTILTSSEKIPMAWINKSNFLSLFAYRFKSSINKRWLNSWFRLIIYLRSVSFKIIDKGIRTTTKIKGEKESPLEIPL